MYRYGWIVFGAALFMLFDSPYGAWLIYRAMGTTTVAYVDETGTPAVMTIGPDAPRPNWAPMTDDALVIGAGKSGPRPPALEIGSFDYATLKIAASVESAARAQLEADGFGFERLPDQELSAPAKYILGLESTLSARDEATGREVRVVIRRAEGWVYPGRTVQIVWARTAPGAGTAWPQDGVGHSAQLP